MRRGLLVLPYLFSLVQPIASQQIWDIWQTTYDQKSLFKSLKPSKSINFTTPSVIGSADIVIDDTKTYQSVWGIGSSLTDSSALVLNNLKSKNSSNYWKLLNYLFNATDGANAAGLTYIRVPLGASDFSAKVYSFDDTTGDTSLTNFNITKAPSYLFSVLKDIKSINSLIKVHVVPWSPPGWMKSSGSMLGGTFKSTYATAYANYLLKCLQGFKTKGFSVYAITIQNEPLNNNPTYPTAIFTAAQEAKIGKALRTLMNNNGFSGVKLIGYDHNWSAAGSYPINLMKAAPDAFDGVAFHCYAGSVAKQDLFHAAYPKKEIWFTECAGTFGSDWWSDVKWHLDNIFIGAIEHNSHNGAMWNLALDGTGNPKLPGTSSCGGSGCRAVVTVNSNGTYLVNQEFYSMAHASKAILPKDVGGPWGKRMGVSVGGNLNWALRVGAYVTGRVKSSDWLRYSLVVLNWDDTQLNSFVATPVLTTIEFRGKQAKYTFPVGVTTLWWYASPNSTSATDEQDSYALYAESDGKQEIIQFSE